MEHKSFELKASLSMNALHEPWYYSIHKSFQAKWKNYRFLAVICESKICLYSCITKHGLPQDFLVMRNIIFRI